MKMTKTKRNDTLYGKEQANHATTIKFQRGIYIHKYQFTHSIGFVVVVIGQFYMQTPNGTEKTIR